MNRNHKKALLLIGVLGSLVTGAYGQSVLPQFPPPIAPPNQQDADWVINCIDPTSTTSPYSTDYAVIWQYDNLFGAVLGLSGTVNFSKVCFGPNGITVPVQGRLGFYIGTDPYPLLANGQPNPDYGLGGSTQDNLSGTVVDDGLTLTFGGYSGVAGNFAIANIVQVTQPATGTPTTKMEYFGKAGIDTYYFGLSDRYFVGESTTGLGVRVQLRVDIIGDTSRCQWKLENTTTAANTSVGLWFGQYVVFSGIQGAHTADYVTVPGMKPIIGDTRFVIQPNAAATNPPENPLPPYVNFGIDQSWAYGLQIVLGPTAQIPDQTQAAGIDVGKAYTNFLFTTIGGSDGGMPDTLLTDTGINGDNGYIEKFTPVPVGPYDNGSLESYNADDTVTIVAYYKSTWSTADYSKPYSLILDAPPVIATTPGNPSTFQNAPIFISVDIDDTRGFSSSDQSVPLEDVEVDLDLPPGMTDVNNPASNHMVQYISSIPPQSVSHVSFNVAVDPTLYGNQQYTVTVKPNPGPTKSVNGTIVVASQPYLQLTGTANMVTAPWQFSSSDWATIIGANSGLVLDQDYQVFGWDPLQQGYVLQTDPQRGFGSFIVSNQNVGYVALGGNPQQVSDLQSGAPQIILQPGWNMIANPYNYAVPLGELVGVPESDNQNAYTFSELANLNYVSGFLAYWSPLTQGYEYTTTFTDLIQPNTGYWIYVESNQPVTIQYPPVFQAFIPGLPDNIGNTPPKAKGMNSSLGTPTWALQLAARANGMIDGKTTIGQTTTAQLAATLSKFKAPRAPVKNAISSSIAVAKGTKTVQLGQALTAESVSSQTWDWQVYTQNAGTVTLTWPNMSSVPNNVQVKLIDKSTGVSKVLRQTANYSFEGKAQSTKDFELVVTTGPALPVIESLSAVPTKTTENIVYNLSVNATTTVTVTHNGQLVATLVSNRSDSSGSDTASWNFLDSANRKVAAGTYNVVVSSTPSGGVTATKSVAIVVH